MELSVIIIGKNNAATLERCLQSVQEAVQHTSYLTATEIIYVDSRSSDDSVQLAQQAGCEVVQITDGFTTAALGRNLGMSVAIYSNYLFLDGDMELEKEWFVKSQTYFEQYQAIRGKRHEITYKAGAIVDENPNFDHIDTVLPMVRPGGFLQISQKILGKKQFTSILRDEEESDLYAQFIQENKIYQIPIPAYKHHNYKGLKYKLLEYFTFERHTGYIVSFLQSLINGYINGYFILQLKYFLAILFSILFYIGLITLQPLFWIGCLVIFMFDLGLKKRSLIIIALLFPFKLISAIIIFLRKPKSTLLWKDKILEIDVKAFKIDKLRQTLNA